MKSLVFLVLPILLYSVIGKGERSKLSSDVINSLKYKEKVDVVLYFGSFKRLAKWNRSNILDMKMSLTAISNQSQKRVLDFLAKESKHGDGSITFKGYWITNVITLRNANRRLLRSLEDFDEVHSIYEAKKIQLHKPVSINKSRRAEGIQWGVEAIGAPEAWKQGYNGSGIVVGSIDSGARATHSSLRDNYVGTNNYGWYDPVHKKAEPEDIEGHGTHTIGTIVGRGGIGVAPEAKWMSCRGFGPFGGDTDDVLACLEFMVCPHDQFGNNEDCSKAPHLISNSWGTLGQDQSSLVFEDIIKSYHCAGIIPVFSIGNSGHKGCGSVGDPGGYEGVIGVGATDKDDYLAFFSSMGPSRWIEKVKPEVVAPGVDVISASSESDNYYFVASGTSMSQPHVSGAIAILLQKDSTLNFEEIRDVLQKGAFKDVMVENDYLNCGEIPVNTVPNHSFGYGRINVLNSLELVGTN